MKPSKAKEILDLNLKLTGKHMPSDCRTAVQMGRDAISRILTMRSYNIAQALMPLPGETSIEDPGLSTDDLRRLKESPLGGHTAE